MTLSKALAIAVQHHQANCLPEAEALYRQILAAEPRHADALHLLGVFAHQVGRHEVGAQLILDAITVRPSSALYHANLGEAYRALRRFDEAESAYRRAIELEPENAGAYSRSSAKRSSVAPALRN